MGWGDDELSSEHSKFVKLLYHPSGDEVIWQYVSTVIKMFPLLGISFKIVMLKNVHRDHLYSIIYNIKTLEETYVANSEIIMNKPCALKNYIPVKKSNYKDYKIWKMLMRKMLMVH